MLLFRISDVTTYYCCYILRSVICLSKKKLIIYTDADIYFKLSAINSVSHTGNISRQLTYSIHLQFVDIFTTHPHNKVHFNNTMTLRSHVCIILNYPACYHAKNKINNSLENDVTLRRICQFITTHDNKAQFCGAK